MYHVTVLHPGPHHRVEEHPPQEAPPTLEWLQEAVGGYIERVPGVNRVRDRPSTLLCNEEGRLLGLPFNAVATELWHDTAAPGLGSLSLVGPVVIVSADTSAELLAM